VLISALIFFVGVGYIAADTAFAWTSAFQPSNPATLSNVALYVLYLLFPLICLVAYFSLESYIIIKILGERRPLLLLTLAGLSFAIGQIFNFVISVHICLGTSGKIDGSLFETLFTITSVALLWWFWISIVEGDYEADANTSGTY
jgi:Chitin synthase export chaperone